MATPEPTVRKNGRNDGLIFGIPPFFLVLLACIIIGAAILASIFMATGPMQNQARSPHEQSREQVRLPR